ncbi:MAG: head GIN domain-containing protein [Pseudomonadota bacterium]
MKVILGILLGLFLAIGIAAAAFFVAGGEMGDVGERDKSKDVREVFDLQAFDAITVEGVYEIDVVVGADYRIEILGAPAEMAVAEITVEDGVLRLGQKRRGERGQRRWRDRGLTAEISVPTLRRISAAGVADGEITGVDAETFEANLSGVGDLDIAGTCGALVASVSGVGDLDASDLKCADVDVTVSGVGDASVHATASVDASVNGVGSIDVYGSPVDVEKSGGFLSSITIH